MSERTIDQETVRLLIQCGEERRRLREQAAQLSNEALAKKFDLSKTTVARILLDTYRGKVDD